jgi:4-hydroxybenzoate polyprenyltransferase
MTSSGQQLGLSLARLMRPENTRFSVLFFVLPQLGRDFRGMHMLGGAVLITALYGLSTVYNDWQDRDIDQANQRDLPLVTHSLSLRNLKGLAIVLGVIVSVLNIALPQPVTIIFTTAYLLIAFVYSAPYIHLSYRGLVGTAVLGLCYLGLPLMLGMSYMELTFSPSLLTATALFGVPVLLYKDFKDQRGDAAHGKNTPVVRYGEDQTKLLSLVFSMLGLALFSAVSSPITPGIAALIAILPIMAAVNRAQHVHMRQRLLLSYMIVVSVGIGLHFWQ